MIFTGNVGIRVGIKRKLGQASLHRQSNDPVKAVCGVQLAMSSIRQVVSMDYYLRCSKCFDAQLGFGSDDRMREFFGVPKPNPLNRGE